MAKGKYDDLVKRLGRLRPNDFVQWLCSDLGKVQSVSFEDREFELTHRRVDVLYKVKTKEVGEFYFHLEFQGALKRDFSIRLHEYATRIRREFKLPVRTVAVFLSSTKAIRNLIPVDRCKIAGEVVSEFHYTKLILPRENWKSIIAKRLPALLPLIPLTKIPKGEEQKALAKAADGIESLLDDELRSELAAVFYLVGGYTYPENVRQVIGEKLMLDLMKSATYRETFEAGEKKKAKAIAKNMLAKSCDIAFIAEVTGLSADEIRKLKAEPGKPS